MTPAYLEDVNFLGLVLSFFTPIRHRPLKDQEDVSPKTDVGTLETLLVLSTQ